MPTASASAYLEAIRHLPTGSVLTIAGVSWAEYEALLAELPGDSRVRLTYYHEKLEVVSPSGRHERWTRLIELIIYVLATELGRPLQSCGSMTIKHRTLAKGAEPDSCFYIEHAAAVVGKEEVDPQTDPPPDLVVEVDVTHGSAPKLAFYAALGVPEIWRYDGERAVMYQRSGAEYVEVSRSLAFPSFAAETLTGLLRELRTREQQPTLEAFRRSLRRA